MLQNDYNITAKIWLYNGEKASWHFLTVPADISAEIKFFNVEVKKSLASIPVMATIGDTSWNTSIFWDSKSKCYILPIKSEVRKSENLREGDDIEVFLSKQNRIVNKKNETLKKAKSL